MASHSFLRKFLLAFVAGFIAVLLFHQGMLTLLYTIGFTPRAPFPMQPTKPFGLPTIWSIAVLGRGLGTYLCRF